MRTVLVIDDNPAVGTALELLLGLREIRGSRRIDGVIADPMAQTQLMALE